MKLTEKQKLMLAIVIFAISGYIIYSTFFKSESVSDVVGIISTDGSATSTENQDIIDLANKFNEISINIELFSAPLFKNLKDLEVPLSPEDSGRPNPFATIGNDTGALIQNTTPASTSTTKKTQ